MSLLMAQEKQNIIQAVQQYGRRLFGFIRGRVKNDEDAEDILQEVWYQLSSQPETGAIESISGWLYRVARNKITDTYRKKKEEALDTSATTDDGDEWALPTFMFTNDPDPEEAELRALFREALFNALQELPENQRNVFIWNEIQEITLQEIANRENENIKTIISRKRYAVQYLRSRLDYLYTELLND
jgi:RNA polymerase sigma factor (sigma-70 family)